MLTARITNPGRELADKLNPYIGTTKEIQRICSLICRHAVTYGRIRVTGCNRQLTEWEQAREFWLEERITELVGHLPHTDEGPIIPSMGGDPRGYNVKLVLPPCYRAGDTWGGHEDGFGVPGS